MNPKYFKELKSYSKSEILEVIDSKSFDKLQKYSIINKEDDSYQFNYVGVIIIDNVVINCYPKYIPNQDNIEDDFKQVIRVIKKYNNLYDDLEYQNDNLEEDISFNLLSMMIFFIEDYFEHGVYSNIENILQINGTGEIDWNRTINYTDPIISDKRPYYIELYTKYKKEDLFDYFRLLHEYIITKCSKKLEKVDLLDLFGLTSVELSDKEQDDFGEIDVILENLQKEIHVEFNTRKQKLLKAMYTFLSEENSFSNENYLTLYGTSTYHVIWEDICKRVFRDKLDKPLREITDSNSNTKLINIIKKPVWYLNEGEFKVDTFRPDLITFWNDYFIIFDAKYYKLKITQKLEKQPGLSDVSKQYLYQLAYHDFIDENNFKGVKNAFLMPTYDGEVENKGHVEIKILHDLGLENIQVIMLPAGEMNQLYLENKKMGIERLNL